MTGIAFAADAAPAAGPGGLGAFLPLILIFAVFYFLLIRPQQKKAKDHQIYLSNLKKGDQVVTSGGIHGEITGLTEKIVTLEIADNLRIKVSRQYIVGSVAAMTASPQQTKPAAGS
jgi:preprotein translocase subunit YajC